MALLWGMEETKRLEATAIADMSPLLIIAVGVKDVGEGLVVDA